MAARATSGWELAALAWLVLIAVPLALIDVAVHRLPDPLTAAAFAGTLAPLSVAALTGHQPGRMVRAAIGPPPSPAPTSLCASSGPAAWAWGRLS